MVVEGAVIQWSKSFISTLSILFESVEFPVESVELAGGSRTGRAV